MEKQEAQNIIKKTFENKFDKKQFDFFIRNLLKENYEKKEFSYQGNIIPRAYQGFINKLERLGQYTDNEDNVLDILAVRLDKKHSIHHARVTQRNFIRWYLNGSRGGVLKDGALVAFYLENSDEWRFSFVKMQYSLKTHKDEYTPAKRYSYLVGKDEGSHTAQSQIIGLLQNDEISTLEELENAFSIEKVTDRFFKQYKELFIQLKETIDNALENNPKAKKEFETKNIKPADFAKKTLGQIVFLYFLQKKGWLGVKKDQNWGQGDRRFFSSLYKTCIDKGQNFFNDYLKHLFYDALANQRTKTADKLKDYYKRFDSKIPFLNGGLFEPMNEYDWKNINLIIPNNIFSNNTLISHDEEGSGVLDVFKRYNFTVNEDEPLDTEVAVDPEMLGKVFENLLEVTDRKSKGAFYTPREIVHYMCSESLINYLDTELNNTVTYQELGSSQTNLFGNEAKIGQQSLEIAHKNNTVAKEDIETFIRKGALILENEQHVENLQKETKTYKFKLSESIRQNAEKIDKALENVKICDPAIGSGAFPVGLLHEIVTARQVINAYLKTDISTYELKRHAIYESIYGVDIEQSAVDIAKLRLWLSLVVDEENYEDIKPLPNLDYKIVCGNSLIGLPSDVFKNGELEKEIEQLKDKYFDTTDKQLKHDLRIDINSKIEQLIQSAEQFISYKIDFDFRLWFSEVFNKYPAKSQEVEILNSQIEALNKQVDAINKALFLKGEDEIIKLKIVSANQQISIVEIELSKINKRISAIYGEISNVDKNVVAEPKNYSFQIVALNKNIKQLNKKISELNKQLKTNKPDTGGFDIVIGNPPYIQIQKLPESKRVGLNRYETFLKSSDIYVLFYELGFNILKKFGVLSFITSNSWLRTKYGKVLRNFFVRQTNPLILLNFENMQLFQTAIVESNILISQKQQFTNNLHAVSFNKEFSDTDTFESFFKRNQIILSELDEKEWNIASPEVLKIKNKVEANTKLLKNLGMTIMRGIVTGYNNAFILKTEEKNNLNLSEEELNYLKPLLNGKDLSKYKYLFNNSWLIYSHSEIKIDQCPNILNHLQKYKSNLLKRRGGMNPRTKKVPYEWWQLQVDYYSSNSYKEFEKPKIMWAELSDKAKFIFEDKGHYINKTIFMMTGNNLKYLLALLNSKLLFWYFSQITTTTGMGATMWSKYKVEQLPIKNISKEQQKPFETIVDYILFLKSQEFENVSDKLMPVYFEEIIDAMVFELYFEEEVKAKGVDVLKNLQNLPDIENITDKKEKLNTIRKIFTELHNENHPVRYALYMQNSVSEIKTIKEQLK